MEHLIKRKLIIAYKYLIKQTKNGCCDDLTEQEFNELIEALTQIKHVYDNNTNHAHRGTRWSKCCHCFRSLLS